MLVENVEESMYELWAAICQVNENCNSISTGPPFFHFSNFKAYIPALSSMKDFIESPNFLGNLTFYVTLPLELELHDLSPLSKLKMVEKYLDYVEKKITNVNYLFEAVGNK